MNDANLLNCPFCGADHTQLYVAKTYDCVKIGCLLCSAQFLLANHFGNNKEAVISAWNARAWRTCYADEVTHQGCKYSVNRGWRERTCRIEERYGDWYCTSCGEMVGTCDTASELYIDGNAVETWNYCPSCGANVVEQ